MNKLHLISTMCLVLCIQSCKNREAGIVFPLSVPGVCEHIDTLFIGTYLNMSARQDDLFIGDFHEPMIIHYNLRDRKMDRFLSEGRGPGETLPPVILYANPFGDNRLYRFSGQAFEMGFYPLDSLSASAYVSLFTLSYHYFGVIPYEENRYLATGTFEDGYRYKVLNEAGEAIHSFGGYPDFLAGEDVIPPDAKGMFHQAEFANSYRRKKVVAASNYVADIIDYSAGLANESIKRILLAPYDYDYTSGSVLHARKKNGIIGGAYSIACNDAYIYMLVSPRIIGAGELNNGINEEIWIFDWDGQPVKKVVLDKRVHLITADPSGAHAVLGLADHGDNGELYEIVRIKIPQE